MLKRLCNALEVFRTLPILHYIKIEDISAIVHLKV